MMCADSVRAQAQVERDRPAAGRAEAGSAHPHRGVVGVSSSRLAAAQEPPL